MIKKFKEKSLKINLFLLLTYKTNKNINNKNKKFDGLSTGFKILDKKK